MTQAGKPVTFANDRRKKETRQSFLTIFQDIISQMGTEVADQVRGYSRHHFIDTMWTEVADQVRGHSPYFIVEEYLRPLG